MRCPMKSPSQAPRSWTPRVSRTPTTTKSRRSQAAPVNAGQSKLTISQLKSMVESHEGGARQLTSAPLQRVQLIPTQVVERSEPALTIVAGDPGAGSVPNPMFSAAASMSSCDNCKRVGVALWEDELTGEAFCDDCWSMWEAQAAAQDDAQQRQETPVEDWFMMDTTTDEEGDCDMLDDGDDDDIDPAVLYGSGPAIGGGQAARQQPQQSHRPAPNFAQRSLVALELGKNSNDLYEMCLDKQLLDAYNNAAVNHRVPLVESPTGSESSKVGKKAAAGKGVKFNTGGAVRFFDTDAELQDPCRCEFPIEVKEFDGQSCHHANYIGMTRAAAAAAASAQQEQRHMSTLADYSSDELRSVAHQMSKPRGGWPRQYYNQAVAMLREKLASKQESVEFVPKKDPGVTGNFEVTVDGAMVHSKQNGDGFLHSNPASFEKDILGENDACGITYITGWADEDFRRKGSAVEKSSSVESWRTDCSVYELFMCSGCNRLASPFEIDEEVVSYYCTNCLEVLPQSAVAAHKGSLILQVPEVLRVSDMSSNTRGDAYELVCGSGECDYHSGSAGLPIAASPDALLTKARSLEDAAVDAEWMRGVLPVYRERCLKSSEHPSPSTRSASKHSGWRSVRHLKDPSTPWSLTDLDAKLASSSSADGDYVRDGLPLSRSEDDRVRVLFPVGSTIDELRRREKSGSKQTSSPPVRSPLAARRSYRHAAKCKKLLLKSQILPDHSQPYSMRAYASDFVPLCALRDGTGGTRPTMRVEEDYLEFYITLRNPRSEPIEVRFDTRLNDDFNVGQLVPPCHSNWPGEISQYEKRHADTIPNLRFLTEPFTILVGGSDMDLSESEIVTAQESPPELVQSQRHRAAVKLTVRKTSQPTKCVDESVKSPLREGLSRVMLKPRPPNRK
ncbi:hypothetical protein FOL46_008381 [Perkinsus olseni]|uniref:Dynactin subunit 4 n=1 Tax=Perkinsus olseni TaxID=32597 RepID=A0A7J6L7I1_PEROL|nr:hypothetical protein FOL46_008381 [Perkinsus olseni]